MPMPRNVRANRRIPSRERWFNVYAEPLALTGILLFLVALAVIGVR